MRFSSSMDRTSRSGRVHCSFPAGLHAVRRVTIWWCVTIAAIVAVTVAFWPAFRGASGISEAIDQLPSAVVDAFGLAGFGTPAGFLRGNLYDLIVPLLLAVAAVRDRERPRPPPRRTRGGWRRT